MPGLDQLSLLLDKQIETQSRLLEIEKQKMTVLTNGHIEELDVLLKLEQPLVMNCANLERQRETMQRNMGIHGKTLMQIVKESNEDGVSLLESQAEELKNTVEKLKNTVRINTAILQERMFVIDEVLSISGVEKQECTYKKDGHF